MRFDLIGIYSRLSFHISVKMRVSANLTMLFTDVPLAARYEKAAAVGFKLAEIALPYSEPAEVLLENSQKFGIQHSLINAPAGIVYK